MSRIISAVIMLFSLYAQVSAYSLVEVLGGRKQPIKWGEARLGSPAVIRFSLARSRFHLEGGLRRAKCDTIDSLDALLKNSALTEEEFIAEARRGLGRWSEVAGATFEYVADAREADVLIGAQTSPSGKAFVNMRVHPQNDAYTAEKGIVCLNPKLPFVSGSGDCVKAFNVAYLLSHEFGHILGLDHPSPGGSLMAFKCSEQHVMSADEEKGARFLYGPPREK
jgi:hypothetical protein